MENKNSTSEINGNVIKYLNDYVDMPNPQFAVMLTGKWGSGKTFFIKKELEKWTNKDKISDDELKRNPIYISLYGISNTKQLVQKLKEEISPIWHSKGVKIAKKIGEGLLKTAIKVDFNSENDNYSYQSELDLISIFKSDDETIKGKKLFIFDDLERSEIPLNQLFGFVNEFVEHHQCKVILVCDEEKLKKLNTQTPKGEDSEDKLPYKLSYKDFKEKLVGQTLSIEPDYEKAISVFIEHKAKNQKTFYEDNKELILKVFKASEKDNLRVLRQFNTDFERFILPLEEEFKDEKEFIKLKQKILVNFLILYLEYKTGTTNIKEIYEYQIRIATGFDFSLNKKDKPKDWQVEFKKRYYWFVRKYEMGLNPVPDSTVFLEYVDEGNTNYITEELKNYIHNQIVIENKIEQEEPNWKKLYNWRLLDNESFENLLESEFNKFVNLEIPDLGVLTHLYYIFENLNYFDTLNRDDNLSEKYIENVKKILDKSKETQKLIEDHCYALSYQNKEVKDDEKVRTTIENTNKLILEHQNKIVQKEIVKNITEFGNGNIKELSDYLRSNHSIGTFYWNFNIFSGVELDEFSNNFFNLKPNTQFDFMFLLQDDRYKIGDYLENERGFLTQFKVKLEEKVEKSELVEKVRFKRYVQILDEILSDKK